MPSRRTHRELGPTRLRHSGPAAFTRSQRKKHPNMHPEGHVQMQDHYESMLKKHKRDTEKYNKYLAEYDAWKKANGKAGGTRRRHRKHRSTRRR